MAARTHGARRVSGNTWGHSERGCRVSSPRRVMDWPDLPEASEKSQASPEDLAE